MSWPRRSLLLTLLILSATQAHADSITVNTTTDDYADNSLCSLREAVEYFNLDKPKGGFQGCTTAATSDSDIITLPADEKPYELNSRLLGGVDYGALFVRRSLSITGAGMSGDSHSWLKVNGAHRAFIVSTARTVAAPACATAGTCSPAGAPILDPASDSGATDFLTTISAPKFTGTVAAPASGSSVRIRLYGRLANADEDSTPLSLGSALADASGNWAITSASSLNEGLYHITYTVTVNDGDEGSESPATQLAVYAADTPAITFKLTALELQGCGAAECANAVDSIPPSSTSYNGLVYEYPLSGTSGKGGLIFANSSVDISMSHLHDGAASASGGAIYLGEKGLVTITTSRFSANKSDSGAAVFAEKNAVFISQSLFTDNTTGSTIPGRAVVQVAAAEAMVTASSKSQITSSTFSENHGIALNLRTGAVVNGSTIVLNEGGIYFNGERSGVYNTILAGNPDRFPDAPTATDCLNLPAASDIDFQFSLGVTGGGCDSAASGLTYISNQGSGTPAEKLMASVNAKGACVGYALENGGSAAFSGMGLLCPLAIRDADTETTASHLPRLLGVYSSAADSPVVGKGSTTTSGSAMCPGTDQRSLQRRDICDLGAVEVQPISASVVSGSDISYGQTYSEALDSELGDEQLYIPVAMTGTGSCPAFALTQDEDKLKPGCPWVTIAPTKGTVVFNADGTYTYKPSSNFHGFDRFSFRVVTTLSKLNSTFDTQSRVVNAQIVVEPSSGISAYSAAGALDTGMLGLLSGLGLLGWRRMSRGDRK